MLLKLSQANHIFQSLKARSPVLFMTLKLLTAYHSASEKKKAEKNISGDLITDAKVILNKNVWQEINI